MSEWSNWQEAFDQCQLRYDQAWTKAQWIADRVAEGWVHYFAQQDHFAIGKCLTALGYTSTAIFNLCTPPNDLQQNYAILYCLDNISLPTDPYVLTWKKICEAWAADDFEGRAVTIAFIDQMRQLIWDEPFFVAWAARPEQE